MATASSARAGIRRRSWSAPSQRGRSCGFALVQELVGWRPRRSLRKTVARTYEWLERERIREHTTFDFAFEDELFGHVLG